MKLRKNDPALNLERRGFYRTRTPSPTMKGTSTSGEIRIESMHLREFEVCNDWVWEPYENNNTGKTT